VLFNAVGIGPNPDMDILEDLISTGLDWRASAFEFEEGLFTEFLREDPLASPSSQRHGRLNVKTVASRRPCGYEVGRMVLVRVPFDGTGRLRHQLAGFALPDRRLQPTIGPLTRDGALDRWVI
jgi:hypothetical protein